MNITYSVAKQAIVVFEEFRESGLLWETAVFETQTNEKFENLLITYQGTCDSLTEEDQQFLESHDLCNNFDSKIFNCDLCGWWCNTSEKSDSGDATCYDCEEES
jgi:hypothetical protein